MSETKNLKLFKHDNPTTNTNKFDVDKALNQNWDKVDEAYAELKSSTETSQEEIESIKTKNTEQDEKISALESDNNTNKTDISNIKQEQTTQNESIEGLKSKDTEHDTKLTELEGKDTELENKIIDLTDKAGNKLKLEIDTTNYIMTLELLNEKGETLDTQTIDFPLESVVVNGRYEEGNIILTLQNETEITIPIGDIVNGLINQETFDQAMEKINTELNGIKERLDTIEEEQSTQNDKLQSLENKDAELTENIETLQKEATTLKEETERLKEDINSLATGQAEGENITIEDGTGARFKKLEISGNSWQETRSGKNLFNVNDRRNFSDGVTVDEDDWITVDYDNTQGTRTIYQYIYTNASKLLKPSTQYSVVLEVKNVTRFGDTAEECPQLEVFNGLSSYYNCQITRGWIQNLVTLQPNTKSIQTTTTVDNFENCTTMLRTQLTYGIGIKGSITFRLSVLEDTSITEDTFVYEKYGAMPSPDFPSEIRNCGENGNFNINIANKNLMKEDNPNNPDENYESSGGGTQPIQYSESEKGYFTEMHRARRIYLQEEGTYIFSIYAKKRAEGDIINGILLYSPYPDNIGIETSKLKTEYTRYSAKINVTKQLIKEGIYIVFYDSIYWKDMQLEKVNDEDNNPTEYVSGPRQSVSFPMKEGQVFHKWDYLADDGVHSRTTEIKVTEDNFARSGYTTANKRLNAIFYLQKDTVGYEIDAVKGKTDVGLCTIMESDNGRNINILSETDEYATFFIQNDTTGNGSQIYFGIPKSTIGCTLESNGTELMDGMKAYAREHDVRFLLPRANTEIIEPYSEEQKKAWEEIKNLRGYDGTTHIFSEDEIKPYMKAEYIKNQDIEHQRILKDLDDEHQKLQSQIDEIKELLSTSLTSAMLLDNLEKDLMEEV